MDTTNDIRKENVHSILAYSYSVYFVAFLVGVGLYFLVPSDPATETMGIIGMIILGLGTLLVFLAQSTSRASRPHRTEGSLTEKEFARGPYAHTRSPTHLGLALLILAFAFFANSIVIGLVALLAYVITRFHFIKKEEALLEAKYGDAYRTYKAQVRW